jgi:hypothetical protein
VATSPGAPRASAGEVMAMSTQHILSTAAAVVPCPMFDLICSVGLPRVAAAAGTCLDPAAAMAASLAGFDRWWGARYGRDRSGSTAVLGVIQGQELTVANAGEEGRQGGGGGGGREGEGQVVGGRPRGRDLAWCWVGC